MISATAGSSSRLAASRPVTHALSSFLLTKSRCARGTAAVNPCGCTRVALRCGTRRRSTSRADSLSALTMRRSANLFLARRCPRRRLRCKVRYPRHAAPSRPPYTVPAGRPGKFPSGGRATGRLRDGPTPPSDAISCRRSRVRLRGPASVFVVRRGARNSGICGARGCRSRQNDAGDATPAQPPSPPERIEARRSPVSSGTPMHGPHSALIAHSAKGTHQARRVFDSARRRRKERRDAAPQGASLPRA